MQYLIVRSGSSWTNTGPSKDKVLSKHKTLILAEIAFKKVSGPAQIKDSDGKVLDFKLA